MTRSTTRCAADREADGPSLARVLANQDRRVEPVALTYGYEGHAPPLRPLVKRHPVTGRRSLFIGRHAYGIPGLGESESERLLDELLAFACQPPRTFQHCWQTGDVAIWDNRCVLHRARPFDPSQPRVMHHTRIAGDPATESGLKAEKRGTGMAGMESTDTMYDLRMSEAARAAVRRGRRRFIADEVEPHTEEFFRLGEGRAERWGYGEGPARAARRRSRPRPSSRACGTSSCPTPRRAQGSSNLDYAYIAIELGKNPIASECLNCSAPDTGNMEVLERVGTPEQKERWLKPLLDGEIRSAYAMTEPDIPSSDAKNIACRAVRDGDEWVINGEKYYISGAGDPRCKIMIVMVQTNPDAPPHQRQSQILVPMDTPGVEILGAMQVFGEDDAPHGHMHLRFTGRARARRRTSCSARGAGSRSRRSGSGPGRIHHCMRSVGAAERALELMAKRGLTREAFGKRIANLGKNVEVDRQGADRDRGDAPDGADRRQSDGRLGNAEARVWVSAVKAMVPIRVCQIIDEAIQMHGATGISQWTPLAGMYASQRTLRLADGPDEVHWHVVGRAELASWDRGRALRPEDRLPGAPPGRKGVQRSVTLRSTLLLLALHAEHSMRAVDPRLSQDYDPSANLADLHSWAWQPGVAPADPERSAARQCSLLNARVKSALEEGLAAKGFARAESDASADFTVAYHLAVDQPPRRERTIYTGYGAVSRLGRNGAYARGPVRGRHPARRLHRPEVRHRDLARRSAVACERAARPPKGARPRCPTAVDQLLAQFPPQK